MSQTFESIFKDNIQRMHYQVDGLNADKSHLQVVIWPTFSGLSQFEKDIADYIASLGFSVTALDLYGVEHNPVDMDEKRAKMGALLAEAESLHALQYELTQSACDAIQGKMIIHVGFCLGGRLALEAGLHFSQSVGVASFHGLMSFFRAQSAEKANTKSKILVLNGHQDPLVTESDAQDAKRYWASLGMDFQFVDFGNAVHSFMLPSADNPDHGSQYHPLVAQRAYGYLANFLEEFV
ncbi:dienelactone hydrolase [Marinomonas sp. M1K-6]|uniref:Dienelactone hydrolase n=1 Tax=Marinomonas profundi TaxID=2726122 RepID=A0A847R3U3_9GAMM|nr:dienelactone hydrolase family protein [Marinomonas profundi]NLQ18625.1 dienelactone hydrolase [Marinomonas profundi]UDV02881.1 dienelactone hydrolase family protein [Marinomonas profundi]